MYWVIMQSYSHIICVRVKEFTDEIKESLEWVRGGYEVVLATESPVFIETNLIDVEEKENFLEESRISQFSYFNVNKEDKRIIEKSFEVISEVLIKESYL
ncbi:hypothetical protein [Sporosarcina sp. FSL W7-1283]|uniref:hypothetical protein n=1 Tax=Sporosarcina sp. FSL W7-1283 TaxID=2921560 RepID=UPI0030F916EE